MSEKNESTSKLSRRDSFKALVGVAAIPALARGETIYRPIPKPTRSATDPNLVVPEVPWENILTKDEMVTIAALCDVILPADDKSPAASKVGVPEFINEWVSAPYDEQQRDRDTVRGGLVWMNTESTKRHGKQFHELSDTDKFALCEEIAVKPKPDQQAAARFFDRFRWLTLSGFYTTPEGRKDVGYLGNVPLDNFPGASKEVLAHLGLA